MKLYLKHRLLSVVLAAGLVVSQSTIPVSADAEGISVREGVICSHHIHNEDCGYTEETPCEYVCEICSNEIPEEDDSMVNAIEDLETESPIIEEAETHDLAVSEEQNSEPLESEGDITDPEVRYRTSEDGTTWTDEWHQADSLINAPFEAGYLSANYVEIELLKDITTDGDWQGPMLAMKQGQHVILDGNNKTIRRGASTQLFTISCGATVTLKNITLDGGAVWEGDDPAARTNSGLTLGGNCHLLVVDGGGTLILDSGAVLQNSHLSQKGMYGAAISVAATETGTLIMRDGAEIKDNTVYCGAVYIWGGGIFTMEGGKIDGNYGTNNGGAVCMGGGTFTMSGGEITGNKALAGGGGVSVFDSTATFTMTGGEITNNSVTGSLGGGVLVYNGSMNVSGTPVVTGNTAKGGDDNNVCLNAGRTIGVSGALNDGAEIGVTSAIDNSTINVSGGNDTDKQYFSSDNPAYEVRKDDSTGEVQLVNVSPTAPKELKATPGSGSVTLTWKAPAEKGGYDISRYQVSCDGNNWFDVEISSPPVDDNYTYTFENLTANQYQFQVRAVNANNDTGVAAKVTAGPVLYNITVQSEGNGTASASSESASVGAEITLTAAPNKGYHFKEWKVEPDTVTINNDKFIMPAENVTVKAIFEKNSSGGGTVSYCVLNFETNGGSSIKAVSVIYGGKINPTDYITTREGYDFSGWYTDKELTKEFDPDTAITYSMVLYAKWTEKQPEDITTAVVSEIPVQTNSGDKLQPVVTVTYEGTALTEGVDYEVTYKNNETPGKATAIITGIGKYAGVVTQDFIIVPQQATGLQTVKKTTTTLKLTFDKVNGADGYEIYDAGSNKHLASCSTQNGADQLIRTLTDLTPGESRQYKVRAYVLIDGKKQYGEFSSIYTQATNAAKPVLMLTVAKTGKTAQTLQWNKISQADGYIIYGSRCGTDVKKLKTIKGNKTTKWTKRNLQSGKYYKYYIVAYRNIDGRQTTYVKSPYAHAVTTNNKYTNPSKITVNKTSVTLTRGKTMALKATMTVPSGKTVRKHCENVRYKTSDKTIATVTSTGKIKGVYTGTCYIYAYTQNGIYKMAKVTVK